MKVTRIVLIILISAFALIFTAEASSQGETPQAQAIVRGAQLYDKWYVVLGVDAPAGNMPIWSRQTTNTRSGPDTWRCSECHGWDYRGNQGEYKSGSHYTGFPDLLTLVQPLTTEDIVSHLKGSLDPAHDFSSYLDDAALNQLAEFLKNGIIDDSHYINPVSLRVIDPDIDHGQQLYQSTCQTCHGEDGSKIVFTTAGIGEYLGSIANKDPWRFLHRTRFGVAGTEMPIGYDLGWSPEDGRDILAYAQTLPTGSQVISQPTLNPATTPPALIGGPATNLVTGILTGLGAVAGIGIIALAFIGGFILMAIIVVAILRDRGKRSK
jgi:Cytochrome C oxidase, cbb3-type, subunit III